MGRYRVAIAALLVIAAGVALGGFFAKKKVADVAPDKPMIVVIDTKKEPIVPPKTLKPKDEPMEKETDANIAELPTPQPTPEPPSPTPKDPISGIASKDGDGDGSLPGGKGPGPAVSPSRWGWYAGQVQVTIAEALRKNRLTRNANLDLQVRIWPDSTGRIQRAKLARSTGDSKMDEAIQNEVLTNLQLQQPPPSGMKLPIVLRLVARR